MTNPVEAAVLPLKNAAIEHAVEVAYAITERVRFALAGREFKRLPYPQSFNMGRNEWAKAKSAYDLESRLIETDGDCRPALGEVQLYKMSLKAIDRFLDQVREDAAAQYDAFVAKLVTKVGEVETADLEGNHVWGYSFLKVVKADGTTETWKTQQIVNVSKLGTVFNQWPTRKVKK